MKENYQDSSEFKGNVKRIRDQVIEEFTGIEELCSMVNFFFTKLYNIENFKEKSKYFLISKQIVFFVLQRSLGIVESLEKKFDFLISMNEIEKEFSDNLIEIKKNLQHQETLYKKNKIKIVVENLNKVGIRIDEVKEEFKRDMYVNNK